VAERPGEGSESAFRHRLFRFLRASGERAREPARALHRRQVGLYAGREWLSDKYSVLDPYAFVFYTWGARRELPMAELKNYTALKDRMLKRQAVQRVIDDENVKL
jgi:glutathione S-transferase